MNIFEKQLVIRKLCCFSSAPVHDVSGHLLTVLKVEWLSSTLINFSVKDFLPFPEILSLSLWFIDAKYHTKVASILHVLLKNSPHAKVYYSMIVKLNGPKYGHM